MSIQFFKPQKELIQNAREKMRSYLEGRLRAQNGFLGIVIRGEHNQHYMTICNSVIDKKAPLTSKDMSFLMQNIIGEVPSAEFLQNNREYRDLVRKMKLPSPLKRPFKS